MSEFVVYTVILGGYDRLMPPLMWDERWKYVCLSDTPMPETPPWEVRLVVPESKDFHRESRRYKALSYRCFPGAEYTLYHDGNIRLNMDRPLRWLKEHDMALCAHPARNCVYTEAARCIREGKGNEETINAQIARYRVEGYPEEAGLAACTIILRRHTEAVRRFNEHWWEEISNGSMRDQLSFNYLCWKLGMKYDVIPGDLFRNERFEYLFPHGH